MAFDYDSNETYLECPICQTQIKSVLTVVKTFEEGLMSGRDIIMYEPIDTAIPPEKKHYCPECGKDLTKYVVENLVW